MKLWLDLETRSPIPIKQGNSKYATQVEIIMAQWAIDGGEVHVEDLVTRTGVREPSKELQRAIVEADEIWAHGAEFEQIMLARAKWFRKLKISRKKWRCTMALCRFHGLPGALAKLSVIFKLPDELAKDKRGYELIRIFCIPQKNGKFIQPWERPKEWEEFKFYGGQDIVSMRAVYRKCPKWNATPRLWAVWHLDQKMNLHGVEVDLLLASGIVLATTKAKGKLRDKVSDATLGVVEAATQVQRLRAFLADFGVDLPDLKADTVERRLEDENLPEVVKELLRARQQASKASTAKAQRVLTQAVGGRLRNLLVMCGANRTGRWAGRTFQPQNLKRPTTFQLDIDFAIEHFRNGTIEEYAPDEVMELASNVLRGLMISAKGRKLSVADLANIEGRYMAWIAGEEWKLEAFRRFDQKKGPDLYKVSYARAFNIDPNEIEDEGDWRRQIGKVMELALQYYGGVGAFVTMAETYGLRLEALSDAAWPIIPERIKEQAKKNYGRAKKRRRTYGLDERVWLVCESLVLLWREAHPAITKFWSDLEKAIKSAIVHPNKVYKVGQFIQVDRVQNWLRIRLPSGRYLSYPAPRAGERDISFVGVNPYTKQWGRISTYSGKAAENIVQGGSADILMDGLLAADGANYNPVLSVHDEIIAEPPDSPEFNDKGLSRLMTESSPWADGLPMTAKGFTGYRYHK